MNADLRLKEIENNLAKYRTEEYSDPICDVDWLIARVKRLTEALEYYRDNIKCLDGGRVVLCPSPIRAIEALEGE